VQHITAAAAAGAGVLITDHYHQYLLPLVDTAYLMRQKQCHPLGTGDDILVELERFGYLSNKQAERHSASS
jgi:lipopolysaccharide export system ATP-binding protein